jgi:hypothetical protein
LVLKNVQEVREDVPHRQVVEETRRGGAAQRSIP